jgi:lactose/L-arabinose transport system substrate-binding protein
MKKNTTRIAAVVGLAVIPALALAGCSGGDDGNGGGGGGSGEDNKLTVWAWDPAFNIYSLEEAEKIYQKDHPDFELEIIETPWEDLQAKLTTIAQAQQTDELPDFFLMQNNAFQKNLINYPDLFSDYSDSDVDFAEFPESVTAYSTLDGVN